MAIAICVCSLATVGVLVEITGVDHLLSFNSCLSGQARFGMLM